MPDQIIPKYSKLTEDDVAEFQAMFSENSRDEIIEHLISLIDDKKVLESKISDWWETSNHFSLRAYLNVDSIPDSRNIVDTLDVLINVARNADMIASVDTQAMHWLAYKSPLALAQMTIARRKHQTINDGGLYIFSNYFTNQLLKLRQVSAVSEKHVIEVYEKWEHYVENYDYKKNDNL